METKVMKGAKGSGNVPARGFRPYAEYKDSGVEWIGEIPVHWSLKRLKSIATINAESLPEDFAPQRRIFYVDISNVDYIKGIIQKEEMAFENAPSRARRIVRDGDVIISTVRTYLRAIAEIRNPEPSLIVSTGFAVIRLMRGVDAHFGAYALRAPYFVEQVVANSVGVSFPAINSDEVSCFSIAIPPLNEQVGIALFLDHELAKVDALLAKKQRLVDLLQEKRTALINLVTTKGLDPNAQMRDSGVEWLGKVPAHWEVKKIKRLCLVRRGASPRPIDDPIYFDEEGEYSWVRIADVTASRRYLYATQERLSPLGKSKSVALEPGELFVSIAASVGKPIITKIKCCIHDGFVYFVGLRESPEYLYYVLSCGEAYKGLGKFGTQLNLNTDTIGDIRVPVPPKAEQEAVVAYLDSTLASLDLLIDKICEGIERLNEFRTALISTAVTGRIDVREELA